MTVGHTGRSQLRYRQFRWMTPNRGESRFAESSGPGGNTMSNGSWYSSRYSRAMRRIRRPKSFEIEEALGDLQAQETAKRLEEQNIAFLERELKHVEDDYQSYLRGEWDEYEWAYLDDDWW